MSPRPRKVLCDLLDDTRGCAWVPFETADGVIEDHPVSLPMPRYWRLIRLTEAGRQYQEACDRGEMPPIDPKDCHFEYVTFKWGRFFDGIRDVERYVEATR